MVYENIKSVPGNKLVAKKRKAFQKEAPQLWMLCKSFKIFSKTYILKRINCGISTEEYFCNTKLGNLFVILQKKFALKNCVYTTK